MERRNGKLTFSAAGGTAGENAKTCKLSIPTAWAAAMGLNEDSRNVELQFDGKQICIVRPMTAEAFCTAAKQSGHLLRRYDYYDGDLLCARIYADFTAEEIFAENTTENTAKTAFGKQLFPTWEDFLTFLEERCIPRQRAGLRAYLAALGLEEYDPVEIVEKTGGRMAEDRQWLEVKEL